MSTEKWSLIDPGDRGPLGGWTWRLNSADLGRRQRQLGREGLTLAEQHEARALALPPHCNPRDTTTNEGWLAMLAPERPLRTDTHGTHGGHAVVDHHHLELEARASGTTTRPTCARAAPPRPRGAAHGCHGGPSGMGARAAQRPGACAPWVPWVSCPSVRSGGSASWWSSRPSGRAPPPVHGGPTEHPRDAYRTPTGRRRSMVRFRRHSPRAGTARACRPRWRADDARGCRDGDGGHGRRWARTGTRPCETMAKPVRDAASSTNPGGDARRHGREHHGAPV